MALALKTIGHTFPLQAIIKSYLKYKPQYVYNSNELDSRFLSCSSRKGGKNKKGGKKGKSGDNPNLPTVYDCRKISHCLPTNNVCPPFEVLHHMPSGVFRETHGECLGMGAGKICSYYMNPEYFSYHNMSFFDFHLYLRQYRIPSPDSKRKPPF